MIELAPNHKIGLPVANPILLAGGSIGYGEAKHPSLDASKFGAVTVGPVLMNSRAGNPPPRLRELEGGFVIDSGLQNRGFQATMSNFSKLWQRLGCPVLVQIAESNPRFIPRMVQRLEATVGVAGIELLLSEEADSRSVRNLLRAIIESCDLPILVKLPLNRATELAAPCVQNEASGLVIGVATNAATSEKIEKLDGEEIRIGTLYGPIVFPQMLSVLQEVVQMRLGCSLIACGGIYTFDHVQQALAMGASAVQIDSAIWTEPGLPERLLSQLQSVLPID